MKKCELEDLLKQKNMIISELTNSIKERDCVINKLHNDIRDYIYYNDIYKKILHENSEEIKKLPAYESAILKSNELMLQLYDRVEMDNIKYAELKNILMKLFPTLLKTEMESDNISDNKPNIELSDTFISESGNISTMTSTHIIDVAIHVISQMKEKLDQIYGLDNDRGVNDM